MFFNGLNVEISSELKTHSPLKILLRDVHTEQKLIYAMSFKDFDSESFEMLYIDKEQGIRRGKWKRQKKERGLIWHLSILNIVAVCRHSAEKCMSHFPALGGGWGVTVSGGR